MVARSRLSRGPGILLVASDILVTTRRAISKERGSASRRAEYGKLIASAQAEFEGCKVTLRPMDLGPISQLRDFRNAIKTSVRRPGGLAHVLRPSRPMSAWNR